MEKDQGKEIDEMLSSLGVAPVSGNFYLDNVIVNNSIIIYFVIILDVLSSLTTSPNKSELYNSMSTSDSSVKGSLPPTPSTG